MLVTKDAGQNTHTGDSARTPPTSLTNTLAGSGSGVPRAHVLRRAAEETSREFAFLARVLRKKWSQDKLTWIVLFSRKMPTPCLLSRSP